MKEVVNILQIPVLRKFLATELKYSIGERIGLTPDPIAYAKFVQAEAHIKGNIARISYFLQLGDIDLSSEADDKSAKLTNPNSVNSVK